MRRTRVEEACSERTSRAWSRRAFWSAEKSKYTAGGSYGIRGRGASRGALLRACARRPRPGDYAPRLETPHPALFPRGEEGYGGDHAGDRGGALRDEEAGGGGGRGGAGDRLARGGGALGRPLRVPQRPARGHRRLPASASGDPPAPSRRGCVSDRA